MTPREIYTRPHARPDMSQAQHRTELFGFGLPYIFWCVRADPTGYTRTWIDGRSGRLMENVRR
jgi:hypothetical protein